MPFYLADVPVCICAENTLHFLVLGSPRSRARVSLGECEFWQDVVVARSS